MQKSVAVKLMSLIILSAFPTLFLFRQAYTFKAGVFSYPKDDHKMTTELEVAPLIDRNGYYDIAILESQKLVAVGYDGQNPRKIFYSLDGGSSWAFQILPMDKSILSKVIFLNSSYGWAVGSSGLALSTNNGGKSWGKTKNFTHYGLSGVKFADSQTGYITSNAERGCQIFRTTNSGKDWQKIYENLEGGFVFDLAALGNDVVTLAINDDHLLRTENAGKTWKETRLTLGGAASIAFTQNGTGWVVGRKGSFFTSNDNGRNWVRPSNLPPAFLEYNWWSIAFTDSKRGVAVGEKGMIGVTYDGGSTWVQVKTISTERLGKVILHGNTGLIIGSQTIYKISFRPDLR